jgi:hypothetical protein
MPDDANAIRVDFDEGEPLALVFDGQALPGALVSWAWCQLMALDGLLVAIAVTGRGHDADTEGAGAVRAVLVPVINALEFSQQRRVNCRSDRRLNRRSRQSSRRNPNDWPVVSRDELRAWLATLHANTPDGPP